LAGRQSGTAASASPAGRIGTAPEPKLPTSASVAADGKGGRLPTATAAGEAGKRAGQAFVAISGAKSVTDAAASTAAKADASAGAGQAKRDAKAANGSMTAEKAVAQAVSQASGKVLTAQAAQAKTVVTAEQAHAQGEKMAGQAGKADAQRTRAAEAVAAGQNKKPTASAAAKGERADGEATAVRASHATGTQAKPQVAALSAAEGRSEAVAASHGSAVPEAAAVVRGAAARPAEAGQTGQGLGDAAGQVAESIRATGGQTDRQILVNLNPPELGQVRILLRNEADGIHGIIRAEAPETLTKLQQEAAPLVARLQADGIEIRRLDFGLTEQQNGHQADAGAAFRDGQAQADAWAGEDGPRPGGSGEASGVASDELDEAVEADAGASGEARAGTAGSVNVQV